MDPPRRRLRELRERRRPPYVGAGAAGASNIPDAGAGAAGAPNNPVEGAGAADAVFPLILFLSEVNQSPNPPPLRRRVRLDIRGIYIIERN